MTWAAVAIAGGGAVLGGVAGAFAPKPGVANFTPPNMINQFSGPFGTATREGFDFEQDPNRQGAVDFANMGLQGQLADILAGASPERIAQFQNAFLQARRPELEQRLTGEKEALEANISGLGRAGSSSALQEKSLQTTGAGRQRSELFGQSIMGGEALANQALQQNLQKFGAVQNLSQQDFINQLAAMKAGTGALNQGNRLELDRSRLVNELEAKRTAQENTRSQSRWKNVIGGATAGFGLGNLFSGSFGGGGGGGGGFDSAMANTLAANPGALSFGRF